MNLKVRTVLVNSVKHAVNAVLTNAALMAMFSSTFNFHDMSHVENLMKAVAACIAGREATVWIPKLLEWSQNLSQ